MNKDEARLIIGYINSAFTFAFTDDPKYWREVCVEIWDMIDDFK